MGGFGLPPIDAGVLAPGNNGWRFANLAAPLHNKLFLDENLKYKIFDFVNRVCGRYSTFFWRPLR